MRRRLNQGSRDLDLVANLEETAALARQEWRVASADLTQVLRLDPSVIVDPLEYQRRQDEPSDLGKDRPHSAFRSALRGPGDLSWSTLPTT